MRKKKMQSYNDGIAKIYIKKDKNKNVRTIEDLEYVGFLCFQEKSKRQEDIEFAEQQGNQLTLKISAPDNGDMDGDRNIVIDDVIYSIIHIDRNKGKRELYFYLEEVRRIAG